jgi:RHS repeat-associated protein
MRLIFALYCISLGEYGIYAQTPGPMASGAQAMASAFRANTASGPLGGPTGMSNVDLFVGAYTTEIPIEIPLGRAGLIPDLQLRYRTGNLDGWLGMGWELRIASIERDRRRGVDFASDIFVLRIGDSRFDLVQVAAGEYRAELENAFLRIRKQTSPDGKPSWEMTDKLGLRYIFGTSTPTRLDDPSDPTKIFSWHLERMQDPRGNYCTFSYTKDRTQIYPNDVQYAGQDGMQPENAVRFTYEDRSDQVTLYDSGFGITIGKRLSGISISSRGTLGRSYRFTYSISPLTQRSLLTSMQQSNGAGTEVLPPMVFQYTNSGGGWQASFWTGGPGPGVPVGRQCVVGDFNGDGRSDLACYTGEAGTWHVALSTGTGWSATGWGGGPGPAIPIANQCVVGDFNGDGKTDLACYTGQAGTWDVALSTGGGWSASVWTGGPGPGVPVGNQCVVGDFNGDGKSDLACYTGQAGNWHVALSTGSGWSASGWTGGPGPGVPVGNQCFVGDFNGDTKADLACYTGQGGNWHVVLSTGSGWSGTAWGGGPGPAIPVTNQCMTGDFNGDGKTDLACYTGQAGTWHVALSTGTGWSASGWGGGPGPGVPITDQCVAGDFNGDGRTDLACYTGQAGAWHVSLSTGAGWSASGWGGGPGPGAPITNQCFPGDFSGDGKTDIACFTGQAGNWHVALSYGEIPDLLLSMKNSWGGTTSLEYDSSSRYPNTSLPFAIPVLGAMHVADGRGNVSLTAYSYEGGYYYSPDREFRGFNHVRKTGYGSNQIMINTDIWFHQGNDIQPDVNVPSVPIGSTKGKAYRVNISDRSGQVYLQRLFTYAEALASPFFQPPALIESSTCNAAGCSKTVRTRYAYDRFGNVTSEEHTGEIASDDWRVDRAYSPNEAAWIVALPSREVISQGIASPVQLAATNYYYDGVTSCAEASQNQAPVFGAITRVVRELDGGGGAELRIAYDSSGNPICMRDPNGNMASQFEYDSMRVVPTAHIDAKGFRSEIQYYGINAPSANGLPLQIKSVTDANGDATQFAYDSFGRIVQIILPDGTSSRFAYLQAGDPKAQRVTITNAAGFTESIQLDGLGRDYLRTSTGADGRLIAVETEYDPRGLVSRRSLPYYVGDTPKSVVYDYDELERLTKQTNPDATSRQYCYDLWTSVSLDEAGRRIRKTFDAYQRLIKVEEYEGAFAACTTVLGPAVSDADRSIMQSHFSAGAIPDAVSPFSTTNYSYDPFGDLAGITDGMSNSWGFTYDALGRLTQVTDPDAGNRTFQYDANGNLTATISARGGTVRYGYDVLNRVVWKGPSAQAHSINYEYDSGAHAKHRLVAAAASKSRIEYQYDAAGRNTVRTDIVLGSRYDMRIAFDSIGRVAQIQYPEGLVTKYLYNGPWIAEIDGAQSMYARYEQFDSLGRPGLTRFGNGVTQRSTFYGTGDPDCPANHRRLCRTKLTDPQGALLRDAHYAYDPVGNITAISEADHIVVHAYDAFDRLIASAAQPAGAVPAVLTAAPFWSFPGPRAVSSSNPQVQFTEGLTYDRVGNIIAKQDIGNYSYGGATGGPHAVTWAGGNVLSYDANGNLLRKQGYKFAYDDEDRITAIRHATGANFLSRFFQRAFGLDRTRFEYSSDGPVAVKKQGSHQETYVNDLYECAGRHCSAYIFKDDVRVARIDDDGQILWYHADHLRSTRVVTGASGAVKESIRYRPFGTSTSSEAASSSVSQRFVGERFDPKTGIYLLGARLYDPDLGRFLQPDRVIPSMFNPQSLNAYSYALNNPVSFFDPRGLVQMDSSDSGGEREHWGNETGTRSKDPDLAGGRPGDANGPFDERDHTPPATPSPKEDSAPRDDSPLRDPMPDSNIPDSSPGHGRNASRRVRRRMGHPVQARSRRRQIPTRSLPPLRG